MPTNRAMTTPEVSRVCPVCGGARGLRGMEGSGEHLCYGARACMTALLKKPPREAATEPEQMVLPVVRPRTGFVLALDVWGMLNFSN